MKSFTSLEIIKTLNLILDIEQRFSGIDYLKRLIRNIAQTFEAKYVFVGHAIKPENEIVQTDVVWAGSEYYDNFTYSLKGTPCENVFSGERVCVYPKEVASKFPEDKLLVEMGVESYIGAPMLTGEGELSGLLVVLDDKPLKEVDFYTAIVDFLAARGAAELEKHYIEEKLKRQVVEKTQELEKTNQELKIALAEIKTLRGIIPICSNCKKIRDDQGFWQQVESYVTKHTEASFTHGICPECIAKLYRDTGFKKTKTD
ncbi:MAG: GAF domain-containing protein [Deltaproteobacteria bacterium]|jgi:transcriptional regulator with GAF, ATPase, and Fis domain|nr:GAF domain-containing protein [Deltaproteobacteria bacterium]